MIINSPALDYYRATTWNRGRYEDTVRDMITSKKEPEKWHFQQYKGDAYGAIKHGQSVVNGDMSYIVDVSGESAQELFDLLIYSDMKPTRIDVQMTIRRPDWWDSIEFLYQMELGKWPGRERHTEARINRGNDTIYIGSRESDRYIRVYVKEKDYVRFEVEYKRHRAVAAMKLVKVGRRNAIAGMLLSEIDTLPQSNFLGMLRTKVEDFTHAKLPVKVEKVRSTDLTKVRWLSSLLPTIYQMTNDSDYGDMVTGWLIDIIERKMNPPKGGKNETEI